MRRFSALEIRLFFVLAGLVALSAVGGLLYYRNHRENLRSVAAEELASVAELKASQIRRWRAKRLDLARMLYAAPHTLEPFASVLSGTASPADMDAARRFMDRMLAIEPLSRVLLLDRELRTVLSTSMEDPALDDYYRSAALDSLQTGRIDMSDLHLCTRNKVPRLGFFLPIPGPASSQGTHVGVLLAEIDPAEYLFPYIQRWPSGSKSAESLMLRREGNSVLFLSQVRHRPDSALKLRFEIASNPELPAVRALFSKSDINEGRDYRGAPVLAATHDIEGTNWFIVAKRDLDEIYAPMRRQGFYIGLFVTSLAACGLFLILALWRSREAQHAREELRHRVEASEALQQSDARYRQLFREMTAGFALHEILCDEAGKPVDYRFLEINPTFERLTGLAAADAVGRTVREVFPGVESIWIERYGAVALTGTPVSFEAYNAPLARTFEVRAYSPERGRFAVLFQDVTARVQMQQERERLNAELLRKNEEMESLIYAASHDLRSPLVNIEGFSHRVEKYCEAVSAALASPDAPASLQSSLSEITQRKLPTAIFYIRGGVKKMNSLIAGLLQISRAGKAAIHPTRIDANAVVADVAANHAFQIQREAEGFRIAPLPPCWADASQLNQVFANLLDNALKYRSPDRPLEIRIYGHSEGASSIYCVEDNGIGIKSEHKDKIWELFHRLSPDGPVKGEGIGLSLVRRIVSRMDGRVWVESTPGQGSRFYLALPSSPPGQSLDQATPETPPKT